MWDLIVSVPDHCLSYYFGRRNNTITFIHWANITLTFVLKRLRLHLMTTISQIMSV